MSKTSMKERNKAIRLAWEREQQLVQEGKATRDWTKEQQADILNPDKGKAYDDQGRAFVGQHMKSAAKYPEYQGNPNNIQFLTYDEHLEAHKGSWQNPTNWYYDPITKEYIDFGDNAPTLCNTIELSDPLVKVNDPIPSSSETTNIVRNDDGENASLDMQENSSNPIKPGISGHSEAESSPEFRKGFGERIMDAVAVVKGFSENHPVLTTVIKILGMIGVTAGASAIVNSDKESSGGSGLYSSNNIFRRSSSNNYDTSMDGGIYPDSSDDGNLLDERSSPKEHIVPGHGQHYHTKDGVIWKEKDPYSRGGKHNDD